MKHPLSELAPEYRDLLSRMKITRTDEVHRTATRLIGFLDHYKEVSSETGVPIAWMAASFEREAASNFHLSPAQGDPWNKVSTHVPKGRGPFKSWEAAAKDAYHIDGLDKVGAANWPWTTACYYGELFNGFGPRGHGKHTGYLWAGTNIYTGGKYVSDHNWDANAFDKQLGIIPMMVKMIELDPSLALSDGISHEPGAVEEPQKAPAGVGGTHDTRWLQDALNKVVLDQGFVPIKVDGNYGRRTSAAVRSFQSQAGLDVDGLAGPKTFRALEVALTPSVT